MRVVLAARPEGTPSLSDFATEEAPVRMPSSGEVLLRTIYLSLDPYQRGRMGSSASHSTSTGLVALGEVMAGGTVAEVVASEDPALERGDLVTAQSGWQQYAVVQGSEARRVDPMRAPISTALGVLGMPGLTGYSGLLEIGKPRPGETVVVAAAAGAVGSLVGQISRIKGARVVGIAGGDRKTSWLRDAGFDVVLDHRSSDFDEQLRAAVPDGIDVYFENVGGRVWTAVEPLLNRGARVPLCGVASAYSARVADSTGDVTALMSGLLTRSITLRGFVFHDFEHLRPRFEQDVAGWLRSGEVIYHEEIVGGLEQAPSAFIDMLAGRHLGKMLVQVGEEPVPGTA